MAKVREMKTVKEIVRRAIDLHFHIGPEIIPRKYTVDGLAKTLQWKMGGFALKSHFFPTVPMIRQATALATADGKDDLLLIGSVTLNWPVGGLNPEAVRTSAGLSEKPIIVWFPTISAKNYLDKSEFEIRPEWVNNPLFRPRASGGLKGISVLVEGRLSDEALDVLKAIRECDAVLATGHISWQESELLAEKALKWGIKVIITHPIYQLIDMPIKIQKRLADMGAFIEVCYSMYSIDKIPLEKLASQIKEIGAEKCILSSDLGQRFSKDPDVALEEFARMLMQEGISAEELGMMMVTNPRKLVD